VPKNATETCEKMRADKWLWHARFFKTRGLASKLVQAGHLRVNSNRIKKPAHMVGIQDVLTFPQARRIRVVRILALSERRGPAHEAAGLYDDLAPEPVGNPGMDAKKERQGRPSREDRRAAIRLKSSLPDQGGLE